MAAEDPSSKKKQYNHKGIYFMICNKVQILPTTLNNQSKPNFLSLEGRRVYKSRRNRKKVCLVSDPHELFLIATLTSYGITLAF